MLGSRFHKWPTEALALPDDEFDANAYILELMMDLEAKPFRDKDDWADLPLLPYEG